MRGTNIELRVFCLCFVFEVYVCFEGKEYFDCGFFNFELSVGGVNCETICVNLVMNFICVLFLFCISGCVCVLG